jgi:hypothetical protein
VVTFLYFYTGIIENGVQLTARDIKKHEMGSSFDKLLSQFKSRLEFPDTGYEYCKFGGNLEYLSFHCVSDKFDKLKNAISDIDKPPVVKMVAMVASSIAVTKRLYLLATYLLKTTMIIVMIGKIVMQ